MAVSRLIGQGWVWLRAAQWWKECKERGEERVTIPEVGGVLKDGLVGEVQLARTLAFLIPSLCCVLLWGRRTTEGAAVAPDLGGGRVYLGEMSDVGEGGGGSREGRVRPPSVVLLLHQR